MFGDGYSIWISSAPGVSEFKFGAVKYQYG